MGIVRSLARPGGNATGVSLFTCGLSAKRLALLKETVPGLGRVAVLSNRGGHSTRGARPEDLPVEQPTTLVNLKAAKALGLTIP